MTRVSPIDQYTLRTRARRWVSFNTQTDRRPINHTSTILVDKMTNKAKKKKIFFFSYFVSFMIQIKGKTPDLTYRH